MHKDVQWLTLVCYARENARALSLALRCYLDPMAECQVPLTASQREGCAQLLAAIEESKLANNPAHIVPWDGDDVPHDQELNLPDDDDDEEEEGQPTSPADNLPALFASQVTVDQHGRSSKNAPWCPIIQPALSRLHRSIFTHLPQTAADGKWFNVYLCFIVLGSIRCKGEFIPSNQITQIISAILFYGRLTMYDIMDEHVVENPTKRYEVYVTMIFICFSNADLRYPAPLSRLKIFF
jgi:hypothetical protein